MPRSGSRTRLNARTSQRLASRVPPRRLPVGGHSTAADLNPSPSQTEHLSAKTEHIWPKTGHIRRESGHICLKSGHICGQTEHLSTWPLVWTPRGSPSAPSLTNHQPFPLLPFVIISCTLDLPPPILPRSTHARSPYPSPIWRCPSGVSRRALPLMPTPSGAQPRSTRRPRPQRFANPPKKSAKNCLSPACPR